MSDSIVNRPTTTAPVNCGKAANGGITSQTGRKLTPAKTMVLKDQLRKVKKIFYQSNWATHNYQLPVKLGSKASDYITLDTVYNILARVVCLYGSNE